MIKSIKVIITESSDEDGWANLGKVGDKLNKRYPNGWNPEDSMKRMDEKPEQNTKSEFII